MCFFSVPTKGCEKCDFQYGKICLSFFGEICVYKLDCMVLPTLSSKFYRAKERNS